MDMERESNYKPVLGVVLLVLSVFFFLVSVGGLVGIWVYNQPLTERVQTTIETTSQDLEGAAGAIELARTELISVQAQLDLLQAILETLGINAEEDLNSLADIVGKVEDTLSPLLDRLSGAIGTLRDSLLSIRDTLERINELPLVNIEIPGIESIEEGATQLQNLQDQIEEGGGKIEQLSQTTQDTVDSLTTGFAELESSTAALLAILDEYAEKIENTQGQLTYLGENVPRWIDYAAVLLSVILVWLAVSQAGLFILGWGFYRGEDLLSIEVKEAEATEDAD